MYYIEKLNLQTDEVEEVKKLEKHIITNSEPFSVDEYNGHDRDFIALDGDYNDGFNQLKETNGLGINCIVSKRVNNLRTSLDNISLEVTARMTDGDLQKAVDLAIELGINKVKLEGIQYKLNDTLLLPSTITLEGIQGATVISLQGVDKPVIGKKGAIGGNTVIKNLIISGDISQPNNTGIVLNDYYSLIENVEVVDCGGNGIHISSENATGTLVENKLFNIVIRNCKGTNIYCDGGNKITDGLINNFISHGSGENKAIEINSSAGWIINNVHTYNHASNGVIHILNGYNTTLSNLYIEDFNGSAICLQKSQENINVNNVSIKTSPSSGSAIYVNKSSSESYSATVNINNLCLVNNYPINVKVVDGDGSDVKVKLSNLSISGHYIDNVKKVADNIGNNVTILDNVILNKPGDLLSYGDKKIKLYDSHEFYGNSAQTYMFKLPRNWVNEKIIIDVKMFTDRWEIQGNLLAFNSMFYISKKNKTQYSTGKFDIVTPKGFTTEPSISLNIEEGMLIINFQPSNEEGYGKLFIEYLY